MATNITHLLGPVGLQVLVLVCIAFVTWEVLGLLEKKDKKKEAPAAPPAPREVSSEVLMALIKKRRSIFPRDYNGEAPPREAIDQMLEAANWAPTHGKTEPWRFVVLSGAALERFHGVCFAAMREVLGDGSDKFLAYEKKQASKTRDKANVSYLIAICMKRKANPEKVMPEWEEVAATSCAVQNMHLMATALGVAAYWSSGGPLDHPTVIGHLGLDGADGDRCLGLFHVGSADPAKVAGYRARRGDIAEKVHFLDE